MGDLSITPETKVAELLDAYPELESVLIDMAPAFKKLKNPVLRRTVAKLATLETAAGMAKLEPRQMIQTLRKAVGQAVDDIAEINEPEGEKPDWVDAGQVRTTIDADALLAKGDMPLTPVMAAAREIRPGDLVQVFVGFKPTPMIEALEKQNFRTYVHSKLDGGFELLIASKE
ncbi:MAG: DUF1858 domain-containing protein [Candidatus Latescibacteria bacterium]|jgi:hypothetical protein|nr:DUF1858 domain-containing protein [Candidatus Latescibacterota bacterium]